MFNEEQLRNQIFNLRKNLQGILLKCIIYKKDSRTPLLDSQSPHRKIKQKKKFHWTETQRHIFVSYLVDIRFRCKNDPRIIKKKLVSFFLYQNMSRIEKL